LVSPIVDQAIKDALPNCSQCMYPCHESSQSGYVPCEKSVDLSSAIFKNIAILVKLRHKRNADLRRIFAVYRLHKMGVTEDTIAWATDTSPSSVHEKILCAFSLLCQEDPDCPFKVS